MDDLAVLVACGESDHRGPATAQLVPGVEQLTAGRIHMTLGLQPARQASPAGARRAEHQVPQEQALIAVATGTDKGQVRIPTLNEFIQGHPPYSGFLYGVG